MEINFNCEKCFSSRSCFGSDEQFAKAATIWLIKPHVINRRLYGAKVLSISHSDNPGKINEIIHDSLKSLTSDTKISLSCLEDRFKETPPFIVVIRELVPKSEYFPNFLEAVVFDNETKSVTFLPLGESWKEKDKNKLVCNEICYRFQFRDNEQKQEICLFWQCDHAEKEVPRRQITSRWLSLVLLDKLVDWSQVNEICISVQSLQLTPVDKYKEKYVYLKNKYGRDLVKNWTEKTDPKKCVYENVAIASYLLLIWEEERAKSGQDKKQSFVDLGCDNGLLVYILTKEGHRGLGIDLTKRKIWDTFGFDVKLKEQQLSVETLFPDYDWLIGNYSKELTPWIPIIAARSSYDCNFFLLPRRCSHDFVGKFVRSSKTGNQYSSYLNYVGEIVKTCGFVPEQDTLRIPSAKRVCYIGRKRSYKRSEEESVDIERTKFINSRIAQCKSSKVATISPSATMEVLEQ